MRACIAVLCLAAFVTLAGCDAANDAAGQATSTVGDFAMGAAAKDQIEVYEIAKRNGDKMQTCVQAMTIAQFFLQSKDEASWKEWKAKEAVDCKAAGMPTT